VKGAETTNNYQYYVYGRVTGGTKTLIGVTMPQNSTISTATGYLTLDDFGSGVTTYPSRPSYIPATVPAPSTTQNDMLSATMISGEGSANIVLDTNAGNTISGQTILLDQGRAFAQAIQKAGTDGTQSYVKIPSTLDAHNYFVVNAPIAVTTPPGNTRIAIEQEGELWLNEPLQLPNDFRWSGGIPSTGTAPGFSQGTLPATVCYLASPCIYAKNANGIFIDNVYFAEQALNGATIYLQDGGGGIPSSRFTNTVWGLGASENYSMASQFRGSGAVFQFDKTSMLGTQTYSHASSTPIMYFNQTGDVTLDWFYESGQGVAFGSGTQGAIGYLRVKNIYCQACYMPELSIIDGPSPLWIDVEGATVDTPFGDVPVVANYGGTKVSFTSKFAGTYEAVGGDTSGGSIGSQINSQDFSPLCVSTCPLRTTPGLTGANLRDESMSVEDGTFANISIGMDVHSRSQLLQPGYSFFTNIKSPAAPTTGTSPTGGNFPAGDYYFYYAPVFANGSAGQASKYGVVTTTGSISTITGTVPTPIKGASSYLWHMGTTAINAAFCANTTNTITLTDITYCANAGRGRGPVNAAGGPAGIQNDKVWGNTLAAGAYTTLTNCSSAASPAVCGSAASGSVAVPTGASPTLEIDTTAVTANSQILVTIDESLGTKLSVTCNSTLATLVQPVVTARVAGTSFTIQINATLATDPACVSYSVIN